MKTPLFMISAAVLSLAAAGAQAATSAAQAFLDRAQAQAEARLMAAKVEVGPQPVQVRGWLTSDGRLSGVHVVGASGSRDTDLRVEQALNRLQLADVPPLMSGSTITLVLRASTLTQAQAR